MSLNFCLVGISNHSTNKIIPAIIRSKNNLKYVVSSKKNFKIKDVIQFTNITKAIKYVERKTIFILCIPPQFHEKHILLLIRNNFNVIVEKPAYMTIDNLKKINDFKILKKKFVFENFMYKYSFSNLISNSIIEIFDKELLSIKINFLIPDYPSNSFRNDKNFILSTIFDIGCYVSSFTVSNKIKINQIVLNRLKEKHNKISSGLFKFISEKFYIDFNIGRSKLYKNEIIFNLKNDFKIYLNYFFYGVKKKKKLSLFYKGFLIKSFFYDDFNQFDYIFDQNEKFFHNKQSNFLNNKKQLLILLEMSRAYKIHLTN